MSKDEKLKEETKKPNKEEANANDIDIVCRECGEKGHISYHCPKVKCFKCGQFGHKSFDCRNKPRGNQRGGRGSFRGGYGGYNRYREDKCYNCGKYGHKSYDCDKPNGKNCYLCGKAGHISNNCPSRDN